MESKQLVLTVYAIYTQDEEPVAIATVAELDAVLDRVAAEADLDAPRLVALDMPERQRSLMVGLRGDVGVLNFVDFNGGGASASKGDTNGMATPAYFYCEEWTGIPDDAEIPVELVRQAAREFLATGERPGCVGWQVPRSA